MTDNTPLYQVFFELQCNLCDRFPAFTPVTIRKSAAHEIFLIVKRLQTVRTKKENATHIENVNGKKRCYVPVTG